MWSVGGAVSWMELAVPAPISQSAPSAWPSGSLLQRAVDQVDARRQAVLGERHVLGVFTDRQQGVTGPNRCCGGAIPSDPCPSASASSVMADSTANVGCVIP